MLKQGVDSNRRHYDWKWMNHYTMTTLIVVQSQQSVLTTTRWRPSPSASLQSALNSTSSRHPTFSAPSFPPISTWISSPRMGHCLQDWVRLVLLGASDQMDPRSWCLRTRNRSMWLSLVSGQHSVLESGLRQNKWSPNRVGRVTKTVFNNVTVVLLIQAYFIQRWTST